MKIGILTFQYANNYGALLQTYALCTTIKKLGHTPIIINRVPNKLSANSVIIKCKNIISSIIENHFNKAFHNFRKNYFPQMTNIIDNEYKMYTLSNMFDAVIVGSDQVWRMNFTKGLGLNYFLDFIPNNIPKISYAASFGTDKFEGDKRITLKIKSLLQDFKAISVREDTGVKICKSIFNVNAVHVLDPVLLLSSKDYGKIYRTLKQDLNIKYIAQYFIDPTHEKFELTKELSSYYKCNIKNIYKKNNESFSLKRLKLPLSQFIYPSIESWLLSIKSAEFVITDSFHGVAFSILFNKQFLCIGNRKRGLSRMTSILNMFGLLNRLILDIDKNIDFNSLPLIDYTLVNNKISIEKEKSIQFLKLALK